MILDARYFENYVHPREGLMKTEHRTLVFTGNAIELCLVDARTFGGVIRFSVDNKGLRRSTGSSSQPMRIRNPFRFAEMSAYRIMTQFQLLDLPENVEAFVEPTPQMAKEGFLILSSSYREGVIEFTVIVTRKMEVSPNYPVAELKFRELQRDEERSAYIGSEADLFGSEDTEPSVLKEAIPHTVDISVKVEVPEDDDDLEDDDDDDDTDSFLDDDSDDSDDSFLDDDELDDQSLESEIPIIVEGQAEVITETIEEKRSEKPKPKPKTMTGTDGKSETKSKTKSKTKTGTK